MIRRVKYHEIDFKKYSDCLENSQQRKYSATKDFLDITSGKQWELLIYNDYEAVMPIPFVKKYGVKIVHNPRLCQQLGIFSPEDSIEVNEKFLHFLNENYLVRIYTFNDTNCFNSKIELKNNFIIYPDLYQNVYAKYSPKRKRKLRLDEETSANSEIKEITYEEAKNFIKANFIGTKNEDDTLSFMKIFELFFKMKYLKFSAFYYKSKIINIIVTFFDKNTVALLGTFNDKEYVKLSGASVLIDKAIKEDIQTHIFDFEGGSLPNIEEFFRGFRPELKPYSITESSKKELFRKLLKLILNGKFFKN
ncbi:hypothetical protein JI747_003565 [Chryseobacterium sp. RG1]|uniref:Acetyltransferase (GNAT) domain-containing protein n=1 Tax=Chryseobacterium tagetis TaxID=2801334 RepID=A0ABS7ZYG6_9FLAO|nr:hypothetical protein [Chryseobacterium tagetis]MCA6066242.1 hypothetical protein [Chryseobacterium tagetis]